MLMTQEKICKKIFTIGAIGPELQRPTHGVQRVGDREAAWKRLCRRVIGHVTVAAKISCDAQTGCAPQHIFDCCSHVRAGRQGPPVLCRICLLAAVDVGKKQGDIKQKKLDGG